MAVEATGKRLGGRYRVLRRLGSGGMATVYLAEDERLGRQVAVKRLHADSPEDVAERFLREARVGASLNHQNLVAVYDAVPDSEGVLIVMEYVDGETLRAALDRGPLAPERALEVLQGVAAALDHVHANGVVHRDVKPANVLLARTGPVKLVDLGIAMAAEGTRLTHTGTVLGTAAYMAPERIEGEPGGPASDVYSLAAVAFEALSAEKAITGRTPIEIARRAVTQPPRELRDVVPDAPEGAADALRRGLSKDSGQRQASAGALVRELRAAYAESPAAARKDSRRARRRAAAGAAAGAAAVPAARDAARHEPAVARTKEPSAPRSDAVRPLPAVSSDADRAGERGPAEVLDRRSRPGRWRVPVALALAACAVAAVVIALSTGGGQTQARHSTQARTGAPHAGQPAPGAGGAGAAASSGSAMSRSASSTASTKPASAITGFYQRAAQGDYSGAWALATPRLQSQVGGFESFRAQETSLRSISFPALTVQSETGTTAEVAFRSVARHSDHTDHCSGSIALVRGSTGWLLDELQNVTCSS